MTDPAEQTQFPIAPYFVPPPKELPYDDGIPLESNRHRAAMNLLIESLRQHWRERRDFFCGGNMFVYYSATQAKRNDFRGPDFFVVLDVPEGDRKSWVVWDEGGRFPDVVVELMSPSTAAIDKTDKKQIYQNIFKTREYYVFDPFDADSLLGWRLDARDRYRPIAADANGRLWCATLGLWLGTWDGLFQRDQGPWLRFFDADGDLVPVEAEAARALVEAARQQVEAAHHQAEDARQDAEQAREEARQQTARAEALAARLRALGVDPEVPD
jgi:Uma2 family endonuclease